MKIPEFVDLCIVVVNLCKMIEIYSEKSGLKNILVSLFTFVFPENLQFSGKCKILSYALAGSCIGGEISGMIFLIQS